MKRFLGVVLIGLLVVVGCWGKADNANTRDNAIVDQQQELYQQNQPLPFFNFSMPRDVFIQIYEARNEARQTYSVFRSALGTVTFQCSSIGFPIPADTQLTNPDQITQRYFNNNGSGSNIDGVVEQPEPDGLYASHNTHGTYVLCVRPDGQVAPHYTEDEVTTWPYVVTIDENGQAHDAGGDSTIIVNVQSGTSGTPSGASPTPAH